MGAALRSRGPGYNARVERALKRVCPQLELAWCNRRRFWLVVKKGGPGLRAYWNGRWHAGYEVVTRWSGVNGQYGSPRDWTRPVFLPLDMRLVAVVRHSNQAALGQKSRLAKRLSDMDSKRLQHRTDRRLQRRDESQAYFAKRHEQNREWSMPGRNPGQVNDYETEADAASMLKGRARAAMLRARGGRLPGHLAQLEKDMAERGL